MTKKDFCRTIIDLDYLTGNYPGDLYDIYQSEDIIEFFTHDRQNKKTHPGEAENYTIDLGVKYSWDIEKITHIKENWKIIKLTKKNRSKYETILKKCYDRFKEDEEENKLKEIRDAQAREEKKRIGRINIAKELLEAMRFRLPPNAFNSNYYVDYLHTQPLLLKTYIESLEIAEPELLKKYLEITNNHEYIWMMHTDTTYALPKDIYEKYLKLKEDLK